MGKAKLRRQHQQPNTREKIIGFWHDQSTFVNSLTKETCRDFVHTGYGLSAISHVAETSRIQGVDLYPEVGYNAMYNRLGNPMPNTGTWTTQRCPLGTNNLFVSWETLTHGDNLG